MGDSHPSALRKAASGPACLPGGLPRRAAGADIDGRGSWPGAATAPDRSTHPTSPAEPGRVLAFRRPVRWAAPRLDELARFVAELVAAGGVVFSAHAKDERMSERDIGEEEVLRILAQGMAVRSEPGGAPDEWLVTFSRRIGGRDGAATVKVRRGRQDAKVVTVMWLDRAS